MKKRTVLIGVLLIALLLTGCAGSGAAAEGDFVCTSALGNHTLAAIGDTMYALTQEKSGDVNLHAFDRAKGAHTVTAVEVNSDELFATMQWQTYNLAADGKKLYAMGARGSGGIYCIDPKTGEAARVGFYPSLEITAWTIADGTAYVGAKDAEGIGVYAIRTDKFELFAEPGEPVLHFDDPAHHGEISSIDSTPDGLLVTLQVGEEPWRTLLLDPKTGETTPVAEDVYSDRTAQNGKLHLACERTADGAQAVLLDENAQRSIVAELDWLYRPIAAGKGFVLERMGEDETRTVLVVDETGEVRSAQLPEDAGPLLGGDARYAYLWDTAEPDAAATLLALDLETLEIVNRFE